MLATASNFLKDLRSVIGKAYTNLRDDAVRIDLVPALGSCSTFLVSRGEDGTGDVVIAGNLVLTYPEPIRYEKLSLTLIGETVVTDLVEKYVDRTVNYKEVYVISENRSLYPSPDGRADPHIEDFQFIIPAHKVLDSMVMPPALSVRSKRYQVEIVYKLIAEMVKVLPGELTFKREEKIPWSPVINWQGMEFDEVLETYADVTYQLSVPKTVIAGTPMPYSFSFSAGESEDSALIDISGNVPLLETSEGSLSRRSVMVPRVKESHIYLVERITLVPADARYQPLWNTPITRRFKISTTYSDTILLSGWNQPESRQVKVPKWTSSIDDYHASILLDSEQETINAVASTAASTLLRRGTATESVVSATPQAAPGFEILEINDTTGINPTGSFSGGKIKVEHFIQSVLVYHDAKVRQQEVPITVLVESENFWGGGMSMGDGGYDGSGMAEIPGNAGLTEEEALALVLEQSKLENEEKKKVEKTESSANPFLD
ncbi:hypothetical protein HK098_000118 [Nowakowskiella sp. JEL0407]|nr:hypothetical protein HK098_000118 [Nowakowskiella sp. JEL0407]